MAITPPTAMAAASPTARVSVATAITTNISSAGHHDFPEKRLCVGTARQGGTDVRDVAERAAQEECSDERTKQLREPVPTRARPGEVAREDEGEGDGRIEVRAGDVPDGVDHRHDHEPERERHPDVSELVRLGVDHDRARAGKDECKGADRLGDQRPGQQRERRHASRERSAASAEGTTR